MVGLLVVDKPLGFSSMAVVRYVRRAAGVRKVGHAGTLDPLATGVVLCAIGRPATRCINQLMGMGKVYEAEVDLSAFTATDDREGAREEIAVDQPPTEAAVRDVLGGFIGEIQQVPPVFSAVHVGGKRAYKLARQGEKVTLGPRSVRIDAIDLLAYQWPIATLRIHCGKGVYIRSLARDLGVALGVGGHLQSLRRTAVGDYTIDMAVTTERLRHPLEPHDLLAIPTAFTHHLAIRPAGG
jgi:tRNA pseudouridine55 synthase